MRSFASARSVLALLLVLSSLAAPVFAQAPVKPPNKSPAPADKPAPPRRPGGLSDLAKQAEREGLLNRPADGTGNVDRLRTFDDAALGGQGVRKLSGQHLALYTDLPSQPEVDELPRVFDLAVPQWCEYFDVPAARVAKWRMNGFLLRAENRERFQRLGLVPADLPQFRFGYTRGSEFWLYEQPSAYYRRHLFLHEGTHGFMLGLLNGAGSPWYMEGLAELLGTHRWSDGRLGLRYFPRQRDETPDWGRIKIVKSELAAGRGLSLLNVFQYDERAHLNLEPYAWCWAACTFFDAHPRYRTSFLEMRALAGDNGPTFSREFLTKLAPDWPDITQQWQLFLAEVDYGYDLPREIIVRKPVQPFSGPTSAEIAADRGWQSTGVRLEAGMTYRLTGSGRFQLATQPKAWWSEANGVTIRYCRGRPLGELLAAVVDDTAVRGDTLTPLARPVPIGLTQELTPKSAGTLYLRVNDSPAELADNAGNVTVKIALRE